MEQDDHRPFSSVGIRDLGKDSAWLFFDLFLLFLLFSNYTPIVVICIGLRDYEVRKAMKGHSQGTENPPTSLSCQRLLLTFYAPSRQGWDDDARCMMH